MASTLSFAGLSAKQCISQKVTSARQNQKVARVSTVVKAADKGGPYGLGLEMAKTAGKSMQSGKAKVPLALEEGEMPLNTYKNKTPFTGTVKSVERIVGPKATGETTHIIIDHGGKMPFWEGQSYGVIPPGTKINSKGKEVAHGVRLYSIASTRLAAGFRRKGMGFRIYRETLSRFSCAASTVSFFDGQTATLCVRRATYWDEEGAEDPEKEGHLLQLFADPATPGTEIMMTGPTGQVMLLPKDPSTPVIMVATGTGIAPMRAYIRRFFVEGVPSWNFTGLAWLFMGVANSDATLYDDEFQECVKRFPGQFRIDYALSREQNNKKGGKMYIQDKVEEYKDQVFGLLGDGPLMYFCGLKGMMPGILSMLEGVCKEKGIDYEEWLEGLKKNGQWHVEVY
ncbi:unnamed protein product [Bathycoccus prasinos]